MLLATLLPDGIQAQSFKKELHAGKPECVVKYNDGKCTQLNGTTGWDGCKGVTQPNMLREYYTYKLGDTTFTPVLCGDKDAFADVDCNKSCKAIAKKNYAGGRCTEVQMNCPGGANNAKVGKCECDKGGGKFEDFPTKGKTDLLAFVTDGAYPGNFGGRAGADSYCQAAAASGGIAGTFRAILSDSTDVPFDAAGSIGFFGAENLGTQTNVGKEVQVTYDLDTISSYGNLSWHLRTEGKSAVINPVKHIRRLRAAQAVLREMGE